jgi:hypothetical protein
MTMARRTFVPLSGRAVPAGQIDPTQVTDTHLAMLADHCVKACLFGRTDPHTAQLFVDQGPHMWHIRSASGAPLSLASGTGQLAWNTDRFPDVETAFQHVLAEAWKARPSA